MLGVLLGARVCCGVTVGVSGVLWRYSGSVGGARGHGGSVRDARGTMGMSGCLGSTVGVSGVLWEHSVSVGVPGGTLGVLGVCESMVGMLGCLGIRWEYRGMGGMLGVSEVPGGTVGVTGVL